MFKLYDPRSKPVLVIMLTDREGESTHARTHAHTHAHTHTHTHTHTQNKSLPSNYNFSHILFLM